MVLPGIVIHLVRFVSLCVCKVTIYSFHAFLGLQHCAWTEMYQKADRPANLHYDKGK